MLKVYMAAATEDKKDFFKNFAKFTEKNLGLRCFPVNFANFLRTATLKNIYERLLLLLILA